MSVRWILRPRCERYPGLGRGPRSLIEREGALNVPPAHALSVRRCAGEYGPDVSEGTPPDA